MSVDPHLLEILACPDTHHAPLDYDDAAQTLTCARCHRVFPVRDGIPVLLLDEATGAPAGPDAAQGTGAAGGAGGAPEPGQG